MEMYKNNNNYVPVLLALSVCKFMKKSPSDARNYLKVI